MFIVLTCNGFSKFLSIFITENKTLEKLESCTVGTVGKPLMSMTAQNTAAPR
jgi:hypothetical protein